MPTEPTKKPSRVAVAKLLTKEIYKEAVCRVVEISETMKPPPDREQIKKMLLRRFQMSVDAAEIFMDSWDSMGKGRFLPKED